MNLKEKWISFLGKPSFKIPEGKLSFVKAYEYDDFTVEAYIQPNGIDTVQRVLMAIPKKAEFPCPAVAVPFYFGEAMLGFDPETNLKIEKFGDIPIMAQLAKRGFITISAEAYHLTYLNEKYQNERFEFWETSATKLLLDNPCWTGMGKLVSDTKLLIDALENDNRADKSRIGIAGHSLGGKMAFYTGCLDDRVKVIIANDFGICWDRTNWDDIWYFGDKVSKFKEENADHSELLTLSGGKPFCLIAGQYDNEESTELIKKAKGYLENDGKIEIINHKSGHIPTYDTLFKAYDFLEKWL